MPEGTRSTARQGWFKSSYSGGNTTECVEAAFTPGGALVRVRDSKDPDRSQLRISARAWVGFISAPPHIRHP
ncbi:DUF397 domain-containing protein [Streptomyces sp. NPDC052225]|uniref:DUF397 domain-containing protein n=1 Tax=Streptomyces sp. NPDC052225 TaxID=3154949 RepID=UPI003437631D